MAYHSDYKDYFFSKSNILAILENTGFPLDDEGDMSEGLSHYRPSAIPDWMKLYAAKGALRTYEAAWILTGREPPTSYPTNYHVNLEEEFRYLNVLQDLAITGEIAFKPTEWHLEDEPKTWLLDHQSILEWCQRTGCRWPLESLMPESMKAAKEAAFASDNVTGQALSDNQEVLSCNRKIEALQAEVDQLRSEVADLSKKVPLHPVHLMEMAIEVQHEYWQSLEGSRPKAESIVSDLKERYKHLSDFRAKAIEAVACPIDRSK